MFDDQTFPRTANWQIADGMTVYGAEGDKLGTVHNYGPQAGFLDVRKGWLFTKDFYVLLGDVRTVDESGVTLRLSKGDLDDARYSAPPLGGQEAILPDGSLMSPGMARKEPSTANQDEETGADTADSIREVDNRYSPR